LSPVTDLIACGRRFYARNWVLGTSGNFSAVLTDDPLTLCITRSAAHKGALTEGDFLTVDADGCVIGEAGGTPSAETKLHLEILGLRHPGAILHTHSVCATMLSERWRAQGGLAIEGYEMLKGLDGVRTHAHREWVPIVANDQDMTRLAAAVRSALTSHPSAHAFLIAGHGLYTWGRTIGDAERHVEILEFLLEITMRRGEGGVHGAGGSHGDRQNP
jgi:methylthioribulose-1-phosphate dehydratase